jgi:hypothetical protein
MGQEGRGLPGALNAVQHDGAAVAAGRGESAGQPAGQRRPCRGCPPPGRSGDAARLDGRRPVDGFDTSRPVIALVRGAPWPWQLAVQILRAPDGGQGGMRWRISCSAAPDSSRSSPALASASDSASRPASPPPAAPSLPSRRASPRARRAGSGRRGRGRWRPTPRTSSTCPTAPGLTKRRFLRLYLSRTGGCSGTKHGAGSAPAASGPAPIARPEASPEEGCAAIEREQGLVHHRR